MPFLYPAFLLSGAVALVYQVLWTRQLGLVFGVTIQAASTVLACFMGGLAIGSYLAGRWSDRLRHPVRAFALVELLIAASALATPVALRWADAAFVLVSPTIEHSTTLLAIARVAFSAVVLVVPAALMGMTYPLVLKAVSRSSDGVRRHASLLYAVNTTGAIAGVMAASLWLIPAFGLRRTFVIGAAVNVAIALAAWIASRRIVPFDAPASVEPPRVPSPSAAIPARARLAVLAVMTLSGAVSLALEIVWFRVLVFYLRPTTYAFASMLAAVLAGLAIGSYIVTPWLRRRGNWLMVFAALQIGIGIAGLTSAFALVRGSGVMVWLLERLTTLPAPYDFVLPLFAAAAFAIVPTAILLGAAFPVGLVLWTGGGSGAADGTPSATSGADDTGRRVGLAYALNVTGAIIGSMAAGFVLVPAMGAQTSLILITSLPLAAGLVLMWLAGGRRPIPVAIGTAAMFVALATSLPDVFHHVITQRYRNYSVLWHREDAQASVTVVERGERSLLIDGMHHSSDGTGMSGYHRGIGALAVVVHPDPRRILVIGMGAGTTAGGATILPNAQTTVVELSPSVVEAGRFFEHINRGILENPNVTFKVADGRHFLKTTRERFDVITADLMLPHLAGAASLYSADYFTLASRALAPGGIMVQWIPNDSEQLYKLMLRSFVAAFPHVSLWMDGGIAIGSNEPVTFDASMHAVKMAYPQTRTVLEEVQLDTPAKVLRHYVTDRERALGFLGEGPMLVDDRPVTEYYLSLPQGGRPADLSVLRSHEPPMRLAEAPPATAPKVD